MANVPTHLDLRVREQYAIELPGLGTAGYVWDHDIVGENGVVDLRWTRGYPADSPARPVGASAPEVVTIRGERAGSVEVRLFQHRRWEPPERFRAEYRFSVTVHAT